MIKVSQSEYAKVHKKFFQLGLEGFEEAFREISDFWKDTGHHKGRDSDIEIAKFLLRGIK